MYIFHHPPERGHSFAHTNTSTSTTQPQLQTTPSTNRTSASSKPYMLCMRSPTTGENALLILAFKSYHRKSNHHVPFSQALVEPHVRDGGTAKAKDKSQAVKPTARNVDGLIAVVSASAWRVSGIECATFTGATYTANTKSPAIATITRKPLSSISGAIFTANIHSCAIPTILFSPSSFRADAIYNKSRTMAAVSGIRSSCRSHQRARQHHSPWPTVEPTHRSHKLQ
jgi:hypothetical protein